MPQTFPWFDTATATDFVASSSADRLPTSADRLPMNMDELLQRCMGSTALAQKLIASFRARAGQEVVELERCLASGDSDRLARSAHQLKGTAANISAVRLQSLFSKLEELGNEERLGEVPQCLSDVRRELEEFSSYCAKCQPLEYQAVVPATQQVITRGSG